MRIESLTDYRSFLSEKQIQPAQGKKFGNIVVLGGGPGSGKNWVVNNITDIPNRYRVIDVDTIVEMAAKFNPPVFEKNFAKFIQNEYPAIVSSDLLELLKNQGLIGFTKTDKTFVSGVLRKFIDDMGLKTSLLTNTLKAATGNNKPNIAFNGTMRHLRSILIELNLLEQFGYTIEKSVDFVMVVTPEKQAIENVEKRNKGSRVVGKEFAIRARNDFNNNLLELLEGNSILSPFVRNIYVVFNAKENVEYYSNDSTAIKNFKYMKVKPTDSKKIKQLKELLNA